MIVFPHLFESKKARIEILRRSVKISACELRSETISCIFGWCPYQNNPRLSWSLHGNLDVTLMLVFCRKFSTTLRQSYDITLTKLRQHLVDDNPHLAKYTLGVASRPPGCVLDSAGFSPSFVEVLSKWCYSFVKVL